jgi:flagellar biosynthesis protein FlhB
VADDNRTERATPRRRQKAREKGQVARSREFPGAMAVLGMVIFVSWVAPSWFAQWRLLWQQWLVVASVGELSNLPSLLRATAWTAATWVGPVILFGWVLAAVGSVVQGGLVLAPQALAPSWDRLNPATNLARRFSLGSVSALLKSVVPVLFILYLALAVLAREWGQIIQASHASQRALGVWALTLMGEIAWKSCLVFLAWSLMDYLMTRLSFERQLRMSRQDLREETKETEGNPQVKIRIRRLQRQMRRRRMLRDVARATVVVTNPTEFAVALEYRPESMDAPVVLAKGRHLLAQRIRQVANWHGVPIVENPPLAQALYRAVDVGQAIPAKLYAVVAELLAFIYRAQGRLHSSAPRVTGPRTLLNA